MIIECPLCKTRYDIKAQLPPEGRTVRCAKCGNIWRAKLALEETAPRPAPVEEVSPGVSEATSASAPTEDPIPQNSEMWRSSSDSNGTGVDEGSSGPSFGESGAAKSEQDAELGEKDAQIRAELAAAVSQMQDAAVDKDESGGKVRWYGGFLKKNNARPEDGEDKRTVFKGPASDPIQFPRFGSSESQKTAANGDLKTLEEAREAVRGVFASLEPKISAEPPFPAAEQSSKEQPAKRVIFDFDGGNLFDAGSKPDENSASLFNTEPSQRSKSIASHAHDLGLVKRSGIDTESFAHRQEPAFESWNASDPLSNDASPDIADEEPTAESHPWLKTWKEDLGEDESDPDAQLRNELRAKIPDRPKAAGVGDGEADDGDEIMQRSIIERLSSWRRPAGAPATIPVGKAPEAEIADDLGELSEGDVPLDRRLVREIEETRDHPRDRAAGVANGGLAIAAAWGLFICIASGLLGGFFAFRDRAADAVPGLAGLYRWLGTPVTAQPLIFDSVQYDWVVQDYKPVILVTGAVYNRGHRNVKVPDFVITVKDDDPALDREYSANLNLNVSEIRPDERGEFQIELQSPSPSITAVELELRNVR